MSFSFACSVRPASVPVEEDRLAERKDSKKGDVGANRWLPAGPEALPWKRGVLPLVLMLLLLSAAACESSGGEATSASGADSAAAVAEEEGPQYSYEVYIQGLLTDTLHGRAHFGLVFDPITRREQWVLSMRSGRDVTSGVYIARTDTSRPTTGTYKIVERPPVGKADSMRPLGKKSFTMIYRTGMRRSFHSQSGTLELTTSTDTLLEGTFQATLDGSAALPGQPPREGTVTMRGDFRAEKATVGFLFGI